MSKKMNEENGVSTDEIPESELETSEEAKQQNRWSKDREKYRRQGHAAGIAEGYEKAKREYEMTLQNQGGANNSFTQGQNMQQQPMQNDGQNPDISHIVQQQLQHHIEQMAYQQHMQKMQEATNELVAKGAQVKGKYSDFDEAISPLAEDKSQQFLDIIPHLSKYSNAGDMLYHMGKDPMILGNLKGLHGTPTGLRRALDNFSKKIEATKEEVAKPSDPIEPPQSGHWVAGSNNKIPSLQEARQMFLNSKKR